MVLLYHGSGSQEVQLVSQVNPQLFGIVKKRVISTLHLYGNTDAADLLEQLPFELWTGTNSFGDEFEVLYLRLGIGKFIQLKLDVEAETNPRLFSNIAGVFGESGNAIRFIAADPLPDDEDREGVSTPTLATSSAFVQRALKEFETLLREHGAVSGVDRIHSALHGYLIEICRESNIAYPANAKITALFKIIRDEHPKLQTQSPQPEPNKILMGLANIVDAMNPVRNHNSMAHPNEDLLKEPEAMLAANAVRSLLHYLTMKLQ